MTPRYASEADFVASARRALAVPDPRRAAMTFQDGAAIRKRLLDAKALVEAPQRTAPAGLPAALPNDSPQFYAAAVDILIGYGVKGAQAIASEPATDARVRAQLETLLSLPAQQRAGILDRLARRTGRHPASNTACYSLADEPESRGAILPGSVRRARR
jgi:hypothetical protein